MKFRLTLARSEGSTGDVTIECDVTTTVAETARALIRAGASRDPHLEQAAQNRRVPLTLRGWQEPSAPAKLMDPAACLSESGIQSGWTIEPVAEFEASGPATRIIPAAGFIEVLTGTHAGVHYSFVPGTNLIGRDRRSRIYLADQSVSRRHAELIVEANSNSRMRLRDLGSANGILIDGQPMIAHEVNIRAVTDVTLGEITLRIYPGPLVSRTAAHSHSVKHTRSPRIAPRFAVTTRTLPSPPTPTPASRIPILAMLAPMLMGGAMYMFTGSPMSLMMMAFSPLMMIGSWIDGRMGGSRKSRREQQRFHAALAAERNELRDLRAQEISARAAETPTLPEIAYAIRNRDKLLWTRRAEHRTFLEVRFGTGALPSRTTLELPERGESEMEHWAELCELAAEYRDAAPVPVLERFDRCGSIGIAGEQHLAEGMARSLVLQLVGLHSPGDMVLACFGNPEHETAWAWLKWLPHVDPVAGPLTAWQLAADQHTALRLTIDLETLLTTRKQTTPTRATVRSHQHANTRNDENQNAAVQELPTVPAVVVLVLPDCPVDLSRLITLAEEGPDVGIHFIWVEHRTETLPAACRTFVELYENAGRVGFVRSGSTVELHQLDRVTSTEALGLAKALAPVEDTGTRVLDESDLPKQVHLRDLHEIDLLGGATPIAQSWAANGSLTAEWCRGDERDPVNLEATIGQTPDGPATIDLRAHGPHALVGGTTGSGKSEFLQTWIMSLAARISPARVNFLLVDYKGGAAFAECTELPHTVGLVTDLSPHLVRRALVSLRAELHYREELLARHGAKDLITMERRSDPEAPPVLIIVIDEFAALAAEVPAFVDGVVDIAQRGRSLGLHLIMATQRPAGVIKDNLRANTNLRIALRMADTSDSSDVIDAKDAAYFDPETPGRGVIKIGPGRMSHFQTGYLGGRVAAATLDAAITVRPLGFSEGAPWSIPPEERPGSVSRAGQRQPPRDIEMLRDGMVVAAKLLRLRSPRRPWHDELPKVIALDALGSSEPSDPRQAVGDPLSPSAFAVGLRDVPSEQAQRPIAIDLETVGNVAILGASGTGKTTALLTVAAVLSSRAADDPVHLYAIDAGGGSLESVAVLPTVGGVAALNDTELVGRVLQHLSTVMSERGPRFARARAGTLGEYRETHGGGAEPRVVLLLDGFAAFRQDTETLGGEHTAYQLLGEIMMRGRAVGVHVILTADRPSAIPAALSSSVQQQFVLRLASLHDYGYAGVKSEILEEAPPGRAVLVGESDEIQFALVHGERELAGQVAGLEQLAHSLRSQGIAPAVAVRNAPERIGLDDPIFSSCREPFFALNIRDFSPLSTPQRGLAVVSGPAGSGQSTAVLAMTASLESYAVAMGENLDAVLLTFHEDGLQRERSWTRSGIGETAVTALAEQLVHALGGTLPGVRSTLGIIGGLRGASREDPSIESSLGSAEPPDGGEPIVFPQPGHRGVIVVERPADAENTAALPMLVALAKAARRANVLVIFEFEQGSASGVWELFSAIKQPNWGLALQPDDGETQTPFRETFGRVKRSDFVPGRGFVVCRGLIVPVQVALPRVYV